ncbi:carbohydrate-binding module family 19 protein [Wickerhamomyces anomalus NRRL Y-366-8]|uniref:chitinase n=1 Tax=Wickerhamomyces anomalus (strain ATCC 58044 / CBS 1984 / NCYC 433 / NRRL Y-366-8) TaxID=683960 RepID=A0A1E3P787_WICAA|nr:carbohydrate-binding module family 19 protein [Wickerhamomyces anomalus NRRL Y-366-8]ODQ61218.1 carbohydrate-binding module family 19 protein [Wickerhamomyces anomalus NRRL Y-366-8]
MQFSTLFKGLALTTLISSAAAAFDANSNKNVVVYWGQASAGSQEDLSYYCDSDDVDIVVLSFMTSFPGTNDVPTLNFASACYDQYSNGLLKCDKIASDIKSCQAKGKKVLLSLGGESGYYGFSGDSQAEDFAGTLWNLFGEGSSDTRPFGESVIDGFDFDIENQQPSGYAALANKLREYFSSGSKDYYLSAAPQCVYPDASVGDLLKSADIDFAFVQFYNNYCNVDKQFNWDTWADYAKNTSPNKNIKLYLGLPGSSSAAGSGYVDISKIKSTLSTIGSDPAFGGVMLWDASQSFTNKVDGTTFAGAIKNALQSLGGSSSNAESSTAQSSSTVQSSSAQETSSEVPSSSIETTSTSSSAQSSIVQSPSVQPTSSTQASSSTIGSSAIDSTTSTSSAPISSQPVESTTSSSAPIPSSSEAIGSSSLNVPELSSAIPPSQQPTSSQQSSLSYPEITSNTFTTPSASASNVPSDCSSLSGIAKAQCLNQSYKAGKFNGETSQCTNGAIACSSSGEYAVCNWGSWVTYGCAAGTTCYAYNQDESVFTGCNFSAQESSFNKRSFDHSHHDHV